MDGFSKLSRETQVVLGGGVLLLILSFFDWQQVSFSFGTVGGTYGLNEWHGVGVLAALLVIAMLIWEVVHVATEIELGTVHSGLVSLVLVLLMALFTVIAFFDKGTARHWPAWIALIVTLVVLAAAIMRARAEGVPMPQAKPKPAGAAASGGAAEPAAPAESAAAAEPAAPVESAAPADSPDEPTE